MRLIVGMQLYCTGVISKGAIEFLSFQPKFGSLRVVVALRIQLNCSRVIRKCTLGFAPCFVTLRALRVMVRILRLDFDATCVISDRPWMAAATKLGPSFIRPDELGIDLNRARVVCKRACFIILARSCTPTPPVGLSELRILFRLRG